MNLGKSLMINVCNLLEFNLNNKIIPKPPNPTPSLTSNHKKGALCKEIFHCFADVSNVRTLAPPSHSYETSAQSGPS